MPIIQAKSLANTCNIAIVVSTFNQDITENLWQGAMNVLLAEGFSEDQIITVWVPGAIEIPLMVQELLASERFAAAIALGAVIRGETSHYDYVCQQVSFGCQKIALEIGLPVIFGVLTTEDEEQAIARSSDNAQNKGAESAYAALEFLSVLEQVHTL
jgi:6,7-dimethyl-8-ribityllumazine synthase